MSKWLKKFAIAMLTACMALSLCAFVTACGEEPTPPSGPQTQEPTPEQPEEPEAPVKLQDGMPMEVAVGGGQIFSVSSYVTANGNTVTVSSEDEETATVALSGDEVTVSAIAAGQTTITLTCGTITLTFEVTVFNAYTVTVDGETVATLREGATYTLPAAVTPADANFEFVAWQVGTEQKQPAEEITVNANVVITAITQRKAPVKVADGVPMQATVGTQSTITVADYITAYGASVTATSDNEQAIPSVTVENGVASFTPAWTGSANVTLACGNISVTFAVTVAAADVAAPEFANGSIEFDLLTATSGTYEFVITNEDDVDYTYEYSVAPNAGATVTGNALTYTATQAVEDLVLTVSVTATASVTGEEIEKQATFTVTVNVADGRPSVIEEVGVFGTIDLYEHANGYEVDLSVNVQNAQNVQSYTVNGEPVTGTVFVLAKEDGAFNDVKQEMTFTVVGTYATGTVTYTMEMNVIDSTAYRMANGNFDAREEGWTGMTGTFADNATYWDSYQSNNEGLFYVGVDAGTETVVSPSFIVGNSGWITFKLGAMRPYVGTELRDVTLEIVKDVAEGEDVVLAKVRNVNFADPEAALRLNDYKMNLSAYKGETVYLRAIDNEDGGDFRCLYLDAINTWYDEEPGTPYVDLSVAYYLNTTASVDLKDSNQVTVAPVLLSQGLLNAQYEFVGTCAQDGLTANGLTLTATKNGEYTVSYSVKQNDVEVATFEVTVTVTNTTELPTFENVEKVYPYATWCPEDTAQAVSVTLTDPENGRFTYAYAITAGTGATLEGKTVTYTPAQAGTVTFTVTVTLTDATYTVSDLPSPTFTLTLVFQDSEIVLAGDADIALTVDVNDQADKERLTLNFADYVIVPAGKVATYAAKLDGEDVVLENGTYTIVYANEELSDIAKEYVFSVTAESDGKTLTYVVTLRLTNTYQYRLANGTFDAGLDGWTLSNEELGAVNNKDIYWEPNDNIPFRNEGNFFNAYATNVERAMGTLTSSTFKVGGSGWITYRLGGAKNIDYVYMEVISANGEKAVKLPNFDWVDIVGTQERGCSLIPYKANLIEYGFALGEEVYIKLTDNAEGDYGLFFLDSVITYYTAEPSGEFNLVSKYRLLNGGFEMNSLYGWTLEGDIGVVTTDNQYWTHGNDARDYEKDGACLFTWWSFINGEVNREGAKGSLKSSNFILKANAIISFQFGGGGGNNEIYVEVVNAGTGEVIEDFVNGQPKAGNLVKYYYQFTGLTEETECYLRVVDNATGGWGCFTFDNLEINCAGIPEGYNQAFIRNA